MILAKFPATWIIRRFKCSWQQIRFSIALEKHHAELRDFASHEKRLDSTKEIDTRLEGETGGGKATAGCTATMRLGNAREQWTIRIRPCTVISLAAEVSANYLQLIAEPCARGRERRSYALGQHRPPPWVRMAVYRVYRVTTSVVNAITNFVCAPNVIAFSA